MPPAIIAAAIPAVASIAGSLISSSSSNSAANTQANAAQAGIDLQKQEYQQTRSDLMPWMTAGNGALGGLSALLGLGGADAQQAAITGLQSGPLFQSLYRQGTNAILGNASATGGLRGGNTEGALYNLGSDTLAQVIQQQIANLTGLSNTGENAAAQTGTFGENMATNVSNLLGQQGAARAGGQISSGQGWAGAINGLGGFLSNPAVLSGIFGSGGAQGSISTAMLGL